MNNHSKLFIERRNARNMETQGIYNLLFHPCTSVPRAQIDTYLHTFAFNYQRNAFILIL